MKSRIVAYWIATALTTAAFLPGAYFYLTRADEAVKGVTALGYPLYFLTLLGVAKLLGCITILVPKFPRLKEWAYAGFTIELIAAFWSNFSTNAPAFHIFAPWLVLAITLASWWLRPSTRVIGTLSRSVSA